MLGRIRPRLTFANVISLIALFVALGGGAYAAVALPKNSVGTKQIKKNAVTSAKIKSNAVTGAKVKNGSLTGADINLATLPKVSTAATADNAAHAAAADTATNAGHATSADSATKATAADHATTADNIAAPEAWHVVGAAAEPAFEPGAAEVTSGTPAFGYEPPAFYKDKEGVVHLMGIITIGTGGRLFRLPAGYRPADKKILALPGFCTNCTATDSPGGDTYDHTSLLLLAFGAGIDPSFPDGLLTAQTYAGKTLILDGLSFRAEG